VIREPIALAAAIAAVTALAFWLEACYPWARKVSATLLAIIFGAALSNLGLVPESSAVYDGIFGPVTSLAIAWLLISVRLGDLKDAGPRMLGAFAIGVTGTVVGVVVGSSVLAGSFGDEAWKLAGVTTGTYSGGGLNFVAVGREVGLSPSTFAAAAAADNLVTAVWLGATLLIPLWLSRRDVAEKPDLAEPALFGGDRLQAVDFSILLALGLVLVWASERLAAVTPAVPAVLWLTTLALAAGQLRPIRQLSGSMLLGTVALHLFFAVIGIGARVSEIAVVGPEVLYLMVIAVGVHGLLLYGVGRMVRLDAATLSVASQAAIGGPTTAMALAIARKWPALLLPGMAVGLLGYAVGNYLGIGIAYAMRGLLS
jgi:uncharacterized membrane protein